MSFLFVRHSRSVLVLALYLWLGAALPMSWAADGRGYGVFKSIDYLQTSTNPPVLLSGAAYSFAAIVQPTGLFSNQISRVTVESPLGFVDELMAPPVGSDQPFAYSFGRESQAELDSYYPTGVYVLRLTTLHEGGRVIRIPISTNSFPTNAPHLANYPAAQAVDSTQEFELKWDPFLGGTTNDFIGLSLVDSGNQIVFRTATFGEEPGLTFLNGTRTSIKLRPNSLAQGRIYYGYLFFEKDVLTQSTNYPGAKGLVGFSKATSFTLQTSSLSFRLESLGAHGKQFVLQWKGDVGRSYVLQTLTDLAAGNWMPVFTNVATGVPFNYTNVMTTQTGAHLFRLLLQP